LSNKNLEISNSLGLETTHLDSKLKDPINGLIERFGLGSNLGFDSGATARASPVATVRSLTQHNTGWSLLASTATRVLSPSLFLSRELQAGFGFRVFGYEGREGGRREGAGSRGLGFDPCLADRRRPSPPLSLLSFARLQGLGELGFRVLRGAGKGK